MFDDVFSPSPKAATRSHRCIDIDFPGGRCHVDCTECEAVVYVTWNDAGAQDYDIDGTEGARCGDCGETYCADCVTTNHPDGDRPLCHGCAETARNRFEQTNELELRLVDAERALESYIERLGKEPDAAIIRATVPAADRLIELIERMHSALRPNIERAMKAAA